MRVSRVQILGLSVLLLLLFWGSRIASITAFPPFIDETLHIRTSELSSQISPLYNADLARLFTTWWYTLFYPMGADPMWTARIATLLVVMLGVAATIGLGKLIAGTWGALFTGLFYLFSNYHMFYERMALSDAVSGALLSVVIYLAYRLSRRASKWDAVLVGLGLFVAFGAKTNAIPYFAIPIVAALNLKSPTRSWRQQVEWAAVALGVGLALSAVLVIVLAIFGYDYIYSSFAFAITSQWTFETQDIAPLLSIERIAGNLLNTINLLGVYVGPIFTVVLLVSLAALLVKRRFYLLLCFFIPAAVFWLGRPQESRYWVTAMATLLLCGAVGAAMLVQKRPKVVQAIGLSLVIAWGLVQWLPFTLTVRQDPAALSLPAHDYSQYVASDASGLGLPEIYAYLQTYPTAEVIGILSNCQGLRYIAWQTINVTCPRVGPSGEDIIPLTELMAESRVEGTYVVLEDSPYTPDSAPGQLLEVIHRPNEKANLSIYDLSP